MSNEKVSALDAMLAQYENNNKPKYDKKEKVYDLKNYFNTFIKEGVKAADKQIRILPTADGTSPFVEFHGHKIQVDGEWKTYACLQHEKNQPCPFCEARQALLATGKDSDKELAKKYNAKLMYVVKLIDRNNEAEGVKFWRFNHDYRKEGIMDKIHSVIKAIKKDITNAETGRDLVLTIQRNQNGVPIVSGIAQIDPTPLSTDAAQVTTWTTDVRTWEDVYAVKTYDFLEIIVKGGVPAWDKDAKKFVDKASLKTEGTDQLQEELTLGVENVKASVTPSTAPVLETEPSATENGTDELPF